MAYGYIQAFLQFPEAKNGKFWVYLANSVTKAVIYDPVNGNPISQPLSIDSDGVVPQFWAETDVFYDLDVRDYLGAQVDSRNNVSVLGGSSGAVGPQGPQGVQGPAGATGATGATGAAGTNGNNGTDGEDGTDGVSLVSIRVDETSSTGKILYNLSSDPNNWIDAGDIVPAGIGQVKVTGTDSLGFLEEKVVAGTDVSIDNSGTQLTINNTAPETYKTQASQYSTVKDFLNAIIEGTSGITVTTSADFNKIVISGAGIGGSGFEPKGEWVSGTTYNEGDGVWYYDDSVSPVINRYYVATATTSTNPYTEGTGWVIMFSIDQLGDQMVKLDNSDSTTGFLLNKIIAGQGITFTRTIDAGGDYITIDGQPTFSVGVNGTDKTISDLGNIVDLIDGELTEVAWDGNNIKVNHDTYTESGTSVFQTATGLPKFDQYGHYKGESDAIEISDVTGLADAITAAGDGKVKIDAEDSKDYLVNKLVAGDGIVITDTGSTLTISKDSVDSFDSYVIASAPNTTVGGQLGLAIGATKEWTEASGMLVAPRDALMQLNFSAKVAYTNIGDLGFSAFNDSQYVNVSNKLVSMTAVSFVGYPWNLTDAGDTFLGTGNLTVIQTDVAGRYQFNLSYVIEATTNTATANGNCILYHYSSTGTVKHLYQCGDLTGYIPLSGQASDARDNPSITFQPYCEAGDIFALYVTASSTTRVSDIWVSGHSITAKSAEEGASNPITIVHYDSSNVMKSYYQLIAPFHNFSGQHDHAWSSVFDVKAGDKFMVTWSKTTHTTGIYDTRLSMVSTYGAKGEKGDPGVNGYINQAEDVSLTDLATGNVLNWNGIDWVNTDALTLDAIQLDIDAGETSVEGRLFWDATDKTLAVGLNGGSTLQVGQESLVYALNNTGATITNGQVVYISGASGQRVVVALAQAVTTPTTQVAIAVATQSIANNASGYFTRAGLIRDLNTSSWAEGAILYVGTGAGSMTTTAPAKPNSQLGVGIVVRSHLTQGSIYVSPYVVPRISQLTDVNTTGAAVGQILGYNGTLWVPVTGGGGADTYTVKATAADDAPSFLYNKLEAGPGMTISTDDDTVTLSVNPPQDSLQTFQIAMADGTGGSFDGSFGHLTAVYVPYNTSIDRMACYITQTGSGNLYLCVYDASFNIVGVSNAFTPYVYGVAVTTMTTTLSLTKNTRYYFGVIGDANGCQLLKYGAAYLSNEPFLAKVDYNMSTPPSTFSDGSSSSDRFWIIGYKS